MGRPAHGGGRRGPSRGGCSAGHWAAGPRPTVTSLPRQHRQQRLGEGPRTSRGLRLETLASGLGGPSLCAPSTHGVSAGAQRGPQPFAGRRRGWTPVWTAAGRGRVRRVRPCAPVCLCCLAGFPCEDESPVVDKPALEPRLQAGPRSPGETCLCLDDPPRGLPEVTGTHTQRHADGPTHPARSDTAHNTHGCACSRSQCRTRTHSTRVCTRCISARPARASVRAFSPGAPPPVSRVPRRATRPSHAVTMPPTRVPHGPGHTRAPARVVYPAVRHACSACVACPSHGRPAVRGARAPVPCPVRPAPTPATDGGGTATRGCRAAVPAAAPLPSAPPASANFECHTGLHRLDRYGRGIPSHSTAPRHTARGGRDAGRGCLEQGLWGSRLGVRGSEDPGLLKAGPPAPPAAWGGRGTRAESLHVCTAVRVHRCACRRDGEQVDRALRAACRGLALLEAPWRCSMYQGPAAAFPRQGPGSSPEARERS